MVISRVFRGGIVELPPGGIVWLEEPSIRQRVVYFPPEPPPIREGRTGERALDLDVTPIAVAPRAAVPEIDL